MRTSIGAWGAAFLAGLGLAPACGGDFIATGQDGGPGEAGGGGDGTGGESDGGIAGSGATPGAGGSHTGAGGGVSGGGSPTAGGARNAGGSPSTGGRTSTGGASAGGTGGWTTGGAPGAGGSDVVVPFPCKNPTPVLVNGQPTGYSRCGPGYEHRPEAVACPSSLPRSIECIPPDGFAPPQGGCTVDADCTEAPNGYCTFGQGQAPGCYCNYGCATDADCSDGFICRCGDPVGACVPSNCTTDDDCGDGLLCTLYKDNPGCDFPAFACQTLEDECATDADCASNLNGSVCSLGPEGQHACLSAGCAIGRPFLVEGHARTASAVCRLDWRQDIQPDIANLSAELRRELCDAWTQIGLMEHASVAAFARFALQLLALGAPADLIERTHAAIADETHHAQLAFGLASAYGGRPVGPGPLAIDGALAEDDLESILEMVIREGCVGETVAAVEAAEALEHASNPDVCRVLETITRDETQHAELAWRFVRWVRETDGEGAARVERAFARVLDEPPAPFPESADRPLLGYGVVGPRLRAEIRRRVLAEIVRPGADAMLGHAALAA